MSARKPATVVAAGAGSISGSKSDNNNISPTLELEASTGEEAAGEEAGTVGAAATAAVAVESLTATATDDGEQYEIITDLSSLIVECGSPRKRSTEGPLVSTCISPSALVPCPAKNVRITRHSSPLLLLNWRAEAAAAGGGAGEGLGGLGGACSDGSEELPSGSSQGNQRKCSAERSLASMGSYSSSSCSSNLIRGRKSIKELKEAKEAAAEEVAVEGPVERAVAAAEENKESKDIKDKEKDSKDLKDSKEKETTPTPTTTTTTTTATASAITVTPTTSCNRVTRKAHAQELALANNNNTYNNNNNTRVTRNRRQSSTVSTEALLPARSRRKKLAAPEPKESKESKDAKDQLLKRKRSDDDNADSSLKYAKLEDDESEPLSNLSIKLEPTDEEQSPVVVTPQSSNRRGRGRPQTKQTPTTAAATRATRHSKAGSPGLVANPTPMEPTPPKRRRVGSTNRSLLAVGKATAPTTAIASTTTAAADEDSKDSLASSMDELLLLAAEIKEERVERELDFEESCSENKLKRDAEMNSVTVEAGEDAIAPSVCRDAANGVAATAAKLGNEIEVEIELETITNEADKSLVTETEAEAEAEPRAELESGTGTETEASKATSLSPELISEGVSVISVKQFYKKPEFLANNLGIEKDPELGEIVTETEIELETETETEMELELETEELETLEEAENETEHVEAETLNVEEVQVLDKLDDSYTLSMCELRVDESGDEAEPESEAAMEAAAEVEEEEPRKEAETKELNGVDDYDDFESEIMEQLAKEGVVDASGNALSASKEQQQLAKIKECDKAKQEKEAEEEQQLEPDLEPEKRPESELQPEPETDIDADADANAEPDNELVLTLVVDAFTEEQETVVNAVADDDDAEQMLSEDCLEYPEENKENLTTTATTTTAATTEASLELDVQLTLKEDIKTLEEELKHPENEEIKPQSKEELKQPAKEKEQGNQAEMKEEQLDKKMENKRQLQLQLEDQDHDQNQHQHQNQGNEQRRRDKERHLEHLGLLTHQAAEQLRLEYMHEAHTRAAHQQQQQLQLQQQQQLHQSGKRAASQKTAAVAGGSASHIESSGTLKTVIKLNRSSSGGAAASSSGLTVIATAVAPGMGCSASSFTRKGVGISSGSTSSSSTAHGVRRQSLKMTFQKGRARGHGAADRAADQHGAHNAEDSYYTIQNENEGASKNILNSGNSVKKLNNRLSHASNNNNKNNSSQQQQQQQKQQQQHSNRACLDSSHSEGQSGQMDHGFYQMVKKDEKEKILIPEKASSFKFHPGRLCEDQCYYCSGKFGLYDTPCHVGQIKSVERQQKILANEEKLTVDNCLCDACFRHVDRRANAPSYKKRLSAPGHLETGNNNNANTGNNLDSTHFVDSEFPSTSTGANPGISSGSSSQTQRTCAVKDCLDCASNSLRRKCVRKSVKKCLLSFEIPAGTSSVWLCEPHYNTVIQSSGCVLCKRRLGKNHMYHITSDTDRLEKALSEMGIPVQLGVGTAVCKLCRYFANLLMKPPDSTKSQKAEFVKNYRKRLLKVHNLQDGSNEASEVDEEDTREDTAAGTEGGSSTTAAAADGVGATTTSSAACDGNSNEEQAMVVEYDGPTDSNSSSSSNTPIIGHGASTSSTQMSKLQAILQQNLAGGVGDLANSNPNSNSNTIAQSNSATISTSASDISNVLRGNPNISMRELFHGEEDLGVHFKVPFGCSSSQRTPEGWTRVQTFLQYDEPTRRLWEELQKPYGNQSSFLRHLILLEKYYRNGDLVLASHATSNASVYTQTVRQRLNSFDHGHGDGMESNPNPDACSSSNSSNSNCNSCSPTAAGSSPPAAETVAAASATGAVTVAAASPASNKNNSQADAHIPLVELNDDDDEDDNDNDQNLNLNLKKHQNQYKSNNVAVGEQQQQQPRLRNVVSVDKLTKQLSSNAVTIIARPKDISNKSTSAAAAATVAEEQQQKQLKPPTIMDTLPLLVPTSNNSRSILKTNLLGMNKAVEILPLQQQLQQLQQLQPQQQQLHLQQSNNNNKPANEKPHKLLDMANKLAQNETLLALQQQQQSKLKPLTATTAAMPQLQQQQQAANKSLPNVAQLLSSPPELISLQRRRTSGAAVVGGSNMPSAATAAVATIPALAGKRLQLQRTAPIGAAGTGAATGSGSGSSPSVIILPDTLTPQERHDSKSWKPTLIPLKEQHKVPIKSPTLFQTADGRRLPAQVQVQSGGKPYLISIIDYNRMCILRREKLLRDQMLKANSKPKPAQQQLQQQQQQQQQQSHGSYAAGLMSKVSANQTARQQLQQLQQLHHQQQQQQHLHKQQQQLPTLQPSGGQRLARLAPKPMPPLSNPQQQHQQHQPQQQQQNASNTQTTGNYQPLLANALAAAAAANNSNNSNSQVDSNSCWLWKNFPDANQYLLNGNAAAAAAAVAASKLPHLTAKTATTTTSSSGITFTLKQQQQQQQQQKLIDNVIMSKIPKSLTVIPQQMGGGGGSGDVGGGQKEKQQL